ncbi:MAG: molybdate ABC transporter substrate-binding protein [Defluviitaleaceae bacterium]|nr:molybdate ABC transporter substrate-binding protein [Defluviitaleaceae bacterium]
MKLKKLFLIVSISVIFLTSCNSIVTNDNETRENSSSISQTDNENSQMSGEILVASAMVFLDISPDLAREFNKKYPNINVNFTHAGAGPLQIQIEEGAPVDVFMSVGLQNTNNLKEAGLIYNDEVINLTRNTVALIVPETSTEEINSFEDLVNVNGLIAYGDPTVLPLGQFATEILEHFDILDKVSSNVMFATDVRQTLNWVEAGNVSAGFVFLTDALTSDKVRVVSIAEPSWHGAAINPVAIISRSENLEAAKAFVNFLSTPEAVKIFENFGFAMY